jgi:hypothetical protein
MYIYLMLSYELGQRHYDGLLSIEEREEFSLRNIFL